MVRQQTSTVEQNLAHLWVTGEMYPSRIYSVKLWQWNESPPRTRAPNVVQLADAHTLWKSTSARVVGIRINTELRLV